MNNHTPGKLILAFVSLVALSASAFASKSTMVANGNGTFTITREAETGFDRDIARLKEEAKQDAEKYCASQGKELQVVDLTSKKPLFSLGYSKATIVFKAANPGELAVAPAAASAATSSTMTGSYQAPAPRPAMTGDLYNDLIKLDDLRKRGILTEEEFQVEKAKILSRSK